MALKLAETGRLHYSGWGSPMILVQTLWGAAWIRLFTRCAAGVLQELGINTAIDRIEYERLGVIPGGPLEIGVIIS